MSIILVCWSEDVRRQHCSAGASGKKASKTKIAGIRIVTSWSAQPSGLMYCTCGPIPRILIASATADEDNDEKFRLHSFRRLTAVTKTYLS